MALTRTKGFVHEKSWHESFMQENEICMDENSMHERTHAWKFDIFMHGNLIFSCI